MSNRTTIDKTPRELGKNAYREGNKSGDNPFSRGTNEAEQWTEGFIWQRIHFPKPRDSETYHPRRVMP